MDLNDVANMFEATDPEEALKSYQKALERDRKLTQLSTDLKYKRSVAIAYGNIASVYDDVGDYSRAVENNLKDLAIYEDMVRADAKNALLRQGLAITYMNTASSYTRAGKIELALDYSNRGLEMMRGLMSSAPANAFQQGIFAAMLVVRGTILTAANKSETAIPKIEHGRSIYESLYTAGTTNHVNAAAAYVKLGEASAKARHQQKAAEYFHHALAIVEPLISSEPADLDALYAAAYAYSGLGALSMRQAQQSGLTLQRRKSDWTEARSWYVQSLNTWRRIEHPNHTAPNSFQAGDRATVAKELKLSEAALASLHETLSPTQFEPEVNLNLCLLPVSGARPLSDGVRRELISAAETPRESFLDRRVRSVRPVLGFPTSGAFWPHNLRRFLPGSRRIRPEIAWVFRPRDLRQPVATSKMPRRPQVQILHGEISGAPHRRRAGRR